MARPKKLVDDKMSRPIPIKFSAFDKMKIKERANREHLPVSVWIRKVILENLGGKKG